MTALATRPPTGKVPWPVVLLEGEEKAGKSYQAALFTRDKRVGPGYWLDLGEGAGDEYASIGKYDVIVHDGTFGSIYGQIEAVKVEAKKAVDAGDPPVVLVVDSATAVWELLKNWAHHRASTRETNRKKLAADPTAEIVISMDLWNDATARYRKFMTLLLTFPGIVIMTARGKEVADLAEDGKPKKDASKVWKVEGNKSLAFDVTAWLRLKRDEPATLEGARSLFCGVRPGHDRAKTLPDDWNLGWFIFDQLKVDPGTSHVRDVIPVGGTQGLPPGMAFVSAQAFLPRVAEVWDHFDKIGPVYREAVARGIADDEVQLPDGSAHILGELIQARGVELLEAQQATTLGQEPSEIQNAPVTAPEPEQAPTPDPEPSPARQALAEGVDEVADQFTLQAELDDLVKAVAITEDPELLRVMWRENPQHLRTAINPDGLILGQFIIERQKLLGAQQPVDA